MLPGSSNDVDGSDEHLQQQRRQLIKDAHFKNRMNTAGDNRYPSILNPVTSLLALSASSTFATVEVDDIQSASSADSVRFFTEFFVVLSEFLCFGQQKDDHICCR
jgi:hypothetical protein